MVTVIAPANPGCAPEATVMPVVESAPGAAQAALAPPPAVVAVHVAVTADAGTVGVHPEKVAVVDETARVQFEALPNQRVKLAVEEEDPASRPKSGSVAEKVIVAGTTLIPVMNAALADLVKTALFGAALACPAARLLTTASDNAKTITMRRRASSDWNRVFIFVAQL